MNEDIKVLVNNDKKLAITWNENDFANRYLITLIDYDFNSFPYKEIDNNFIEINKKELKKYHALKIEYILREEELDKDTLIGYSNILELHKEKELKELVLSSIKSYKGVTISFFSKEIYDKYRIYLVSDKGYDFIDETEDFQINSNKIKEGKKYLVEAYKKINDKLTLVATSGIYTCKLKVPERKTKKAKVSAIVPVYNSELFIARCIDSVLLSTMTDLELILVNDGSKDDSKKIIEWYQKKYPTIVRVHNKENEGVSYTRNKGIDLATGEFIAFIDNDDMVHPYMYECLYTSAKEAKADCAIAKTIIRTGIEEYKIYMDYQRRDNREYFEQTYDEVFDHYESLSDQNIYFVAVWNKIIKATIAKGKYYDKQNYYEDQAYTRMVYSYCDKFIFCYDAYYLWDKRIQKTKGTQSNTYTVNNAQDLDKYNQYVLNSDLYAFKCGNPKRIERTANSFIRDAYNGLKNRGELDKDSVLRRSYYKTIREMNEKTDLLNNPYIKKKEEFYEFVRKIITGRNKEDEDYDKLD